MTLDLTAILVAMIGAGMPIVGAIAISIINARMKDKQAADVIANAVKNSIGILVESAQGQVTRAHLSVHIPNVPEVLQAPVQYVLDHAGPEMARHGITAEAIAEKVIAQIGLAKIADPNVPNEELLKSVTTESLNRAELERVNATIIASRQ